MGRQKVQVHIDDISRGLSSWLGQILPDVCVSFPNEHPEKPIDKDVKPNEKAGVAVAFHSIALERPDRATLHPVRNFIVTYALTVWAASAFEQQRIYSEIYFHAFDDKDWQIAASNGEVVQQLSFIGPVPLCLSRKIPRLLERDLAPPVKGPIKVEMTGLTRIAGRVISEQGVPIPRANIEAPSLGRRLQTDNNGKFTIEGAPATGEVGISITARGRVAHLSVGARGPSELAIIMAMEEAHA